MTSLPLLLCRHYSLYYDVTNSLNYDVTAPSTMTSLPHYYAVTTLSTMTSLSNYYFVTNPSTMTSLTPLL